MKKKSKKEENELSLEAISQYKMDDLESKAYKLAIKWVQISKKVFPNYNHTGIKKGDPRKSMI
jgi:FKBP-type peptidyl-prolyl cis-trans isomerase (trigger factor)